MHLNRRGIGLPIIFVGVMALGCGPQEKPPETPPSLPPPPPVNSGSTSPEAARYRQLMQQEPGKSPYGAGGAKTP